MGKMYYDSDCNLGLIKDKTIAVIGYGSQGHAHAQNLRDSGMKVIIGLYEGSQSAKTAKNDGFTVLNADEATKQADIVMLLVNDEKMKAIYDDKVAPNLKPGATLCFAHGFNIEYDQIVPPKNVNVVMIAPKGPGHTVRSQYAAGIGVPCLVAVENDATGNAWDIALAYACAIGGGRVGILETTFTEETETDLFGEQCVLCGAASSLIKAGFDIMVEAGYQPESAYFECLHEMKLIVDMMAEGGLSRMRFSVSDTAEFGDYEIGDRIISEPVKDEMRKVLKEVQDGSFAKKWLAESAAGKPNFYARRKAEQESLLETVGAELRAKMKK